MKPSEMLLKLKSEAGRRTHAALDAIYQVCDEQMKRGATDFSYAQISRLGVGRGVPRLQTIRNEGGKYYRILIESFREASPARKLRNASTGEYAWIEEIGTPRLKFLATALLAELKDSQRLIKEFVPPNQEIFIDDRRLVPQRAEFRLSESERYALEHLISQAFLDRWKFTKGKMGEVRDPQGSIVFKPGTVDAIEKALKHL